MKNVKRFLVRFIHFHSESKNEMKNYIKYGKQLGGLQIVSAKLKYGK